MNTDECSASAHKFKLHDWRWLGWPLSNPSAGGRWCCLCGLAQGKPEGRCQTPNCLEYAAGGNDFCKSCRQSRMITNAAARMRDLCVDAIRETINGLSRTAIAAEQNAREIDVLIKVREELKSLTFDSVAEQREEKDAGS